MKEGNSYSRYEKVAIIAARSTQIAHGAPPLVAVPGGVIDPIKIADLEWDAGVIPIEIKDGKRHS